MSDKFALVIGGTGFISTYCVELLANSGYNVAIMTRGSTPDIHGDLVKARLKVNCDKSTQFVSALKSSLSDMAAYQGLSTTPDKWDIVVDFICFEPKHAEDVVSGLSGLTKAFVFISTDSVYEVCKPQPHMQSVDFPGRTEDFDELLDLSHDKLMEMDDYGYNKWLCERVFQRALPALPYVAVRLPDVMGEREYPRCRHLQYQLRVMLGLPVYINAEKHGYAAPDLSPHSETVVKLKSSKKPVKLSFVYAGDVASAILSVAEEAGKAQRGETNVWPTILGEAFNIGSHEQVTLMEYVSLIADTLHRTPYFFSSGKQRLATIKYAQHLASQQKTQEDEAKSSDPTPIATSYTRILTSMPKSSVSEHKVDIAALANSLNTEQVSVLLQEHDLRSWTASEDPTTFVDKLFAHGHEVDSDSSSSDSSSSDDDDVPTKKNQSKCIRSMDAVKMVRREHAEDDDMYSYLPSVDQGPVSMSKACATLPNWAPTPLKTWCRRMTLWYAHNMTVPLIDTDARSRLNKMVNAYESKGYTFD